MKENTETDLVKSIIEGNEFAFYNLTKKYKQKIYWISRRMLGNHLDADELTQEVLIVIYNKIKFFNFNSSLYTWIYKITTTRCINFLRKKQLRNFFSIEDVAEKEFDKNNDIIKNIEDKEKIEKVNYVLQKLPLRQREVFILKSIENLTYEEISEITGKAIGTLKANYFHAIKKIMGYIKDEEQK
ncbi:MAG: RNA polymerase sigma factor [Ignavibacteriales bacterium]|nr:RNA polymerase sigma factor [Ignavibacteriales bacterium]